MINKSIYIKRYQHTFGTWFHKVYIRRKNWFTFVEQDPELKSTEMCFHFPKTVHNTLLSLAQFHFDIDFDIDQSKHEAKICLNETTERNVTLS